MTVSSQLFLEAHTEGNIEHTQPQLLNTRRSESISSKSISNANTLNEANNENNVLRNLRLKSSNKALIDHININSLRRKFELLTEMVQDKVDLLMIFATKILHSQTLKPYRLDRISKQGGKSLYFREDIPAKLINSSCTNHGKEYLNS